jgi:sulfur carrier protein
VIRVNGSDEPFVEETVGDLLRRHNIEPRGIAVAVDGEVIRRGAWSETPLHDGAQVEIVTAAAGG